MRRLLRCGLGLSLLLLSTLSARALVLDVVVDGVHSNNGTVVIGVFNRPEGFPDGDYAIANLRVPASVKPFVVEFDDLPPGLYAVGAYHDENGNGRLDQGFFGFPAEGYALSNDVRAVFWRPRFADASFTLSGAGGRVALHIEY